MQFGRPAVDATVSALATLVEDPIVVVDIGCRWGFADQWHRLGAKCQTIGFDPDIEECTRLEAYYEGRDEVRLVPVGLSDHTGTATLYMTKDPGGWSLLPTVKDIVERHPALDGGKIVGTTTVDVTTLDSWCAAEGVDHVDVIKIDTQGSELSILKGADHTLEHVSAVEVEVEFNPLYEDVPLFGEIDKFLRDRGFVLWRFRDMAHYAQEGTPTDWWGEEFFYYDAIVARFLTGGGQLFWSNAYYFKRDMAYPSPAIGWETLLRNACMASAMGFHDLVGLALLAARDTAPADVVAKLDATLAEDPLQLRNGMDFTRSTTVLQGEFRMASDDGRFTGWGWRPAQQLDFGAVRWTGPAREASIDLPYRLLPGSVIRMLIVASMNSEILDGLTLEVNREQVPMTRSLAEHGIVFEGVLPPGYTSDRHYTRMVLRTPETIPWNTLHPESWDDTELGVALAWVSVTAP